jgi:hypothetical protein
MENLEKQSANFEYFEEQFKNKKELSLEDLKEMKESGITLENYLNYLHKTKGYLFHGSRTDIPLEEEITGDIVYASSKPEVAILKALYKNNAENLGYPMNIEPDGSNMRLVIDKPKEDTEGESGFIYVLEDSDFEKDENSNWQHKSNRKVPCLQKIAVEPEDFNYPVEIRS